MKRLEKSTMSFQRSCRIILFAVLVGLLAASSFGQEQDRDRSKLQISDKQWDIVLDTLFPRVTKANKNPKGREFAFDIRISPAFGRIKHLSIEKFGEYADREGFRFTLYVPVEKKPLNMLMRSISENDKNMNLRDLANKIEIKKTVKWDQPRLEKLVMRLFRERRFTPERNVILDGVSFEIWYKDFGTDYYFSRAGSTTKSKQEPSSVTLARELIKRATDVDKSPG